MISNNLIKCFKDILSDKINNSANGSYQVLMSGYGYKPIQVPEIDFNKVFCFINF